MKSESSVIPANKHRAHILKKKDPSKIKDRPKAPGRMALARIRKYFKDVERVEDANEPMTILVRDEDKRMGTAMNEAHCALAKACGRTPGVIGAVIGISYSYLVYKTKAVRYFTGSAIQREIVSFDRHRDFSPGTYRLVPVPPTQRIGQRTTNDSHARGTTGRTKPKRVFHFTDRIRSTRTHA